jgi:hypothetical protein
MQQPHPSCPTSLALPSANTLTTPPLPPPQALFKRVSGPHQPPRVSVDSGANVFHYLLEGGACFLTLTERGYPKVRRCGGL